MLYSQLTIFIRIEKNVGKYYLYAKNNFNVVRFLVGLMRMNLTGPCETGLKLHFIT